MVTAPDGAGATKNQVANRFGAIGGGTQCDSGTSDCRSHVEAGLLGRLSDRGAGRGRVLVGGAVPVLGIDSPAGEHPHAPERELGVAVQHQRLDPVVGVPDQDHGRGRDRRWGLLGVGHHTVGWRGWRPAARYVASIDSHVRHRVSRRRRVRRRRRAPRRRRPAAGTRRSRHPSRVRCGAAPHPSPGRGCARRGGGRTAGRSGSCTARLPCSPSTRARRLRGRLDQSAHSNDPPSCSEKRRSARIHRSTLG